MADKVPDEKTIGVFRNEIGKGVRGLFDRFDKQLLAQGLVGKQGKIIDASFVDVPRQRNSRDDNDKIKNGEVPESFSKNAYIWADDKLDARWVETEIQRTQAQCGGNRTFEFGIQQAEV